jgi:hypothetical protein
MANAVILRDISRDGRSVLQSSVTGNVRLSDDNLRATNKLAKTQQVLKQSPQAAPLIQKKQLPKAHEHTISVRTASSGSNPA